MRRSFNFSKLSIESVTTPGLLTSTTGSCFRNDVVASYLNLPKSVLTPILPKLSWTTMNPSAMIYHFLDLIKLLSHWNHRYKSLEIVLEELRITLSQVGVKDYSNSG